jgi:hypothetical protein
MHGASCLARHCKSPLSTLNGVGFTDLITLSLRGRHAALKPAACGWTLSKEGERH